MSFSTYIFDLDGTLYRGNTLIPGASETIHQLRNQDKNVFFMTNSATRSRLSLQKKLGERGIEVNIEELYPSSYLLAEYISKNFPKKSVFCVSESGLVDELKGKNIKIVDNDPDLVAVGLDRKVTYEKLGKAFRFISNGARFFATNMDMTFPVEDGFMPGAGALVSFLIVSTGIRPTIVGKPHKEAIEIILNDHNLSKKGAIVIGDRLDTDILTAKNAQVSSALVLTGVSKKIDITKTKIKPNFVLDSIVNVLDI